MNTKEKKSSSLFDNIFITIFVSLSLLFNIITPKMFQDLGFNIFNNPYNLLIFYFWNILFGYKATLVLFSFFPKRSINKLEKLTSIPKVALLYLTKDDALYEPLNQLINQNYTNYDIFVLDDSENVSYSMFLDQFPYKKIRRKDKKGYKAGNINNWLNQFGLNYKYFIVLDSDSFIPHNYIEEMLKYSEYYENNNVAIFQSKLTAYESKNLLSKYQQLLLQLNQYFFEIIANRITTMQNWGHNILVRTDAIMDCGGFNEEFIGEDVATTFDLIEIGWLCRFVDIPSWENVTVSLEAFTKRNVRIFLSNFQILIKGKWSISVFHKIFLFMSIFPTIVMILTLPLLFYFIWFFPISINNFECKLLNIYFEPLLIVWGYTIFLLFFDFPLYKKANYSLYDFCIVKFTGITLMIHLIVPILLKIKNVLIYNKLIFEVTQKDNTIERTKFIYIFPSILIFLFLVAGVIFNPVTLLFNAHWLIIFFLSFFMLLIIEKETKTYIKA